MGIKESWESFDKRMSHKKISFLININKVVNLFKGLHKKKDTQWVYECGKCIPKLGYRSDPYCKEHGSRLVRVNKK